MKPPSNIYESPVPLDQEHNRLKDFGLPMSVSLEAIGDIAPGSTILDIGAGSNPSLGTYLRDKQVNYTALDQNLEFLNVQQAAGSQTIRGDIRNLPIAPGGFDVAHTRFVIAHLGEDQGKAIQQVFRTVKPGGKAIYIDYDWTQASGSLAFNEIRDLFIKDMLFDAAFGSRLETSVKAALSETAVSVTSTRFSAPRMFDYSQLLNLREAANIDLTLQNKDELIDTCNRLFDELALESESESAPGFQFPDFVTVTATKNTTTNWISLPKY